MSSPSDVEVAEMVESCRELVTFANVPSVVACDRCQIIQYTIGRDVITKPHDWIGLFRSGWKSWQEYVRFAWSESPGKKNRRAASSSRKVTFRKTQLLGLHFDGSLFEFVYLSSENDILGVSNKFQLIADLKLYNLLSSEQHDSLIEKSEQTEEYLDGFARLFADHATRKRNRHSCKHRKAKSRTYDHETLLDKCSTLRTTDACKILLPFNKAKSESAISYLDNEESENWSIVETTLTGLDTSLEDTPLAQIATSSTKSIPTEKRLIQEVIKEAEKELLISVPLPSVTNCVTTSKILTPIIELTHVTYSGNQKCRVSAQALPANVKLSPTENTVINPPLVEEPTDISPSDLDTEKLGLEQENTHEVSQVRTKRRRRKRHRKRHRKNSTLSYEKSTIEGIQETALTVINMKTQNVRQTQCPSLVPATTSPESSNDNGFHTTVSNCESKVKSNRTIDRPTVSSYSDNVLQDGDIHNIPLAERTLSNDIEVLHQVNMMATQVELREVIRLKEQAFALEKENEGLRLELENAKNKFSELEKSGKPKSNLQRSVSLSEIMSTLSSRGYECLVDKCGKTVALGAALGSVDDLTWRPTPTRGIDKKVPLLRKQERIMEMLRSEVADKTNDCEMLLETNKKLRTDAERREREMNMYFKQIEDCRRKVESKSHDIENLMKDLVASRTSVKSLTEIFAKTEKDLKEQIRMLQVKLATRALSVKKRHTNVGENVDSQGKTGTVRQIAGTFANKTQRNLQKCTLPTTFGHIPTSSRKENSGKEPLIHNMITKLQSNQTKDEPAVEDLSDYSHEKTNVFQAINEFESSAKMQKPTMFPQPKENKSLAISRYNTSRSVALPFTNNFLNSTIKHFVHSNNQNQAPNNTAKNNNWPTVNQNTQARNAWNTHLSSLSSMDKLFMNPSPAIIPTGGSSLLSNLYRDRHFGSITPDNKPLQHKDVSKLKQQSSKMETPTSGIQDQIQKFSQQAASAKDVKTTQQAFGYLLNKNPTYKISHPLPSGVLEKDVKLLPSETTERTNKHHSFGRDDRELSTDATGKELAIRPEQQIQEVLYHPPPFSSSITKVFLADCPPNTTQPLNSVTGMWNKITSFASQRSKAYDLQNNNETDSNDEETPLIPHV